ncbi:hypothetical protein SKB0092_41960 (plasmid) [Roseomonas mucosa]
MQNLCFWQHRYMFPDTFQTARLLLRPIPDTHAALTVQILDLIRGSLGNGALDRRRCTYAVRQMEVCA